MTERFSCLDVAKAARLTFSRKSGAEYIYTCPRHDDKHPSLAVNEQKDVWMCGPCGVHGTAWQLAAFIARIDPADKSALRPWLQDRGLISAKQPNDSGSRHIVATYPYHDKTGKLLFEVVRFEPKDFRQRRPDGSGGWIWNLNGVRRVLYCLPEVLKAEAVYIVEGEKDANALRTLGLAATCNVGGAGKWRAEYGQCFKASQRVTIIPDNDDPGRKHGQQVAESLIGKVASLKILDLPGLGPKGDVSDWLAAGGTLAELEALAAAAPEFVQTRTDSDDPGKMRFTRLGDLLAEPEEEVRWLVADHLPVGGDSLLVAKPKTGKSTLVRALALSVARGEDFLGWKTTKGPVFYLALEEKRAEVKRHFSAMGAVDGDLIYVFCATAPADGLAQLHEAAQNQKPVLIIVDPLFRFVRVKDANDYASVTNALEPLHALAREIGTHVLAVHHLGKGDRQGGDAVLGSTAIFASVDTTFIMKRNDKYRTLQSIQRYGTELEEMTLQYDTEKGTLSAGVARSEADLREAEKAILDFLATQSEPIEERTIQEAVEGRKGVKSKALRRLIDAQKISRTGIGRKGDPYLYKVSGFSPPDIHREPEKPESERDVTDSKNEPNTGSQVFDGFDRTAETREPVFSTQEEEAFDI